MASARGSLWDGFARQAQKQSRASMKTSEDVDSSDTSKSTAMRAHHFIRSLTAHSSWTPSAYSITHKLNNIRVAYTHCYGSMNVCTTRTAQWHLIFALFIKTARKRFYNNMVHTIHITSTRIKINFPLLRKRLILRGNNFAWHHSGSSHLVETSRPCRGRKRPMSSGSPIESPSPLPSPPPSPPSVSWQPADRRK